jgi:hypothetical protein
VPGFCEAAGDNGADVSKAENTDVHLQDGECFLSRVGRGTEYGFSRREY